MHDITEHDDRGITRRSLLRGLALGGAAAGLGLWHWNVDGPFTENPHNRTLLGHGARQGGALQTLFEPAEAPAREGGAFEQAIRERKFEVEYRIERPEGGHRWIVLRGTVEHDARGNPQVVQGVTADVLLGIATGAETRQQLYTMLTRGRYANHVHLEVVGDGDAHSECPFSQAHQI